MNMPLRPQSNKTIIDLVVQVYNKQEERILSPKAEVYSLNFTTNVECAKKN